MTKSTAASIAAIAVFYALLQVFVLPPNGFFTGDQGPKYLQAAAFAAQGPLSPDIHVLSRDVDTGLDYQDPILHRRGSHLVSAFSWLLPMLTAPFLRLLGMRGSYVIPAFSVMVIFVTARRLGRALGLGSGLWSAWAAVAATPVLFFGAELWEHAPAAAAVMTTAVLLAPRPGAVAPDREPIWRFAAAGACAVVAALFREEGGLALPSFLIARAIVTRNGRDTARATGGALLGAAAAFSASVPLNVAVYGSRLPLHLSSEIEKTHAYLATRLDAIRDMVLPAPGAALFVVAVLVAAVALRTSRRRSPASRAMIASASVIGILASMAAGPLFRLIAGAPEPFAGFSMASAAHTWIFALALVYCAALPPGATTRPGVARFLLTGAAILVAATMAIVPSAGGAQWSPRYLVCAAPLLAVLAPLAAWQARLRLPPRAAAHVRGAVCGILALSVIVQVEGLAALVRTKRLNGAIVVKTADVTAPGVLVVTTVPWFPEINASLLASRRILFAASPDRLRDVVSRARAIGIREIDVVTQPPDRTIVPEHLDGRCRLPAGNGPIALGRELELRRYTCND